MKQINTSSDSTDSPYRSRKIRFFDSACISFYDIQYKYNNWFGGSRSVIGQGHYWKLLKLRSTRKEINKRVYSSTIIVEGTVRCMLMQDEDGPLEAKA